jgi:hypothetical protein
LQFSQINAFKMDRTAGSTPVLHDGSQASCLTGPISPQEHGHAAARHFKIDPMQDVIGPDVVLDPGQA